MRTARRLLGALGVGVAAYGGWLLASEVPLGDLFALGIWLALAVVLHDGVVVPVSSGIRRLVARRGRALPSAAVRVIEIGLSIGGVVTLFAAAEIWAKARGNANPTILTGPYAWRLVLVWVVISLVVTAAVWLIARRAAQPRDA